MATINIKAPSTSVVDAGSDAKAIVNEFSNAAGVNTIAIQDTATSAKVLLRGTGDTILIEGFSGEYTAKASGKTVTLKSETQTINIVLSSMTKAAPVTAKIVFMDGELNLGNSSGSTVIKLGDQQLKKKAAEISATPADQTAAANYFDNATGTPTGASTFTLTESSDTLHGDSGNNTFKGRIGTVDGLEANTLNSGDSIDGQGGNSDTLQAQVFAGGTVGLGSALRPIQPEIQNVEVIKLEAQYRDINIPQPPIVVDGPYPYQLYGYGEDSTHDDVYIRASEMTDVDQLWSYNSTGDLIIQDLTTLESNGNVRNTKDMTIGMAYTGNSDHQWDQSDYKVYFDQDYLIPRSTNDGSQLYIELMDMDAALTGGNPLESNPFGQIVFTMDGVEKTLTFGNGITGGVKTYAQLLSSIQAAITAAAATDPKFAQLTATLDGKFTATDTDGLPGGSAQGDRIVITNSGAEVLGPVTMRATGDAPAGKDFHTGFSALPPSEEAIPVEINIALEKVGDSGDGGELVIGSMNKDAYDSNTLSDYYDGAPYYNDTVGGFEKFNVTVYGNAMKPSSLAALRSTNNTLETVVVKSETRTDNSYADLIIGNRHATFATEGYGLKDVLTFDSTAFKGDATILAVLTDEMDEKYHGGIINANYDFGAGNDTLEMNVQENPGQGLNVDISMGEGNDDADIEIDGDSVDAVTESFSLHLGNGDNTAVVHVMDQTSGSMSHPANNGGLGGDAPIGGVYDPDGVDLITTGLLQNLSITSGSGADSVEVLGMGQFDIHVGSGSDFVFIDAGGSDAEGDIWTGIGDPSPDLVLYKAQLQIRVAGFESTVAINTTAANNFKANEQIINQAILAAINANPEVKRLVEAELGTTDQNLILRALVDGNNPIELTIFQPDVIASGSAVAGQVTVASTDVNAIAAGLIETGVYANSDAIEVLSSAGAGATGLDVNDIDVVFGDGVMGTTSGLVNGNLNGSIAFYASSSTWPAEAGVEGPQVNNSVINMGTGANDLVVLSSNDASSNVLVFDAAWGKVSIVNFFSDEDTLWSNGGADGLTGGEAQPGADADNGFHKLDFTAFLTNTTSDSGSTLSAEPIPIEVYDATGNLAAIEFEANNIVFANLDDIEAAYTTATNLSFGSLTDAQVQAALNATGGFNAGNQSADGPPNVVVEGTRTSLLFVQNVDAVSGSETPPMTELVAGITGTNYANYGEYKVYKVTYDDAAVDTNTSPDAGFTVSLLGTLDFGNSLDITALAANPSINLVGGLNGASTAPV